MEIAPLVGAIGLGQCTSGIYPVFEILGHPDELAGVHRFSSLEQGGFGLPHRRCPDMLSRSSHDRDMLVAELAPSKGLFGLRQVVQLTGYADSLGRRTSGEPALPAQPGNDANRSIGSVLTGRVEAAEPAGE